MKFDDVKEILIAEADRMGLESYEVYYMESAEINAATLKNEISSFSSGVQGGVCRCGLGRQVKDLLDGPPSKRADGGE